MLFHAAKMMVRSVAALLGLKVIVDEKIIKGPGHFDSLTRSARDAGSQVVMLASYQEDAVALHRAYYVPIGPGTGEYRKALGKEADDVFSTSQWEFHGKHPGTSPTRS